MIFAVQNFIRAASPSLKSSAIGSQLMVKSLNPGCVPTLPTNGLDARPTLTFSPCVNHLGFLSSATVVGNQTGARYVTGLPSDIGNIEPLDIVGREAGVGK